MISRALGLVVLLAPEVALAAANTFQELAFEVIEILDTATFTLIIFGLVVYFWGIATNIPHFGDALLTNFRAAGGERRSSPSPTGRRSAAHREA